MGSRNRKDPVQQSPVGQGDRGVQDLGGVCVNYYPPVNGRRGSLP